MEAYSHQDAYNDLVDFLCDLTMELAEGVLPSNHDLDKLHYMLQVENSLRHLNGHRLFED